MKKSMYKEGLVEFEKAVAIASQTYCAARISGPEECERCLPSPSGVVLPECESLFNCVDHPIRPFRARGDNEHHASRIA